MKFPDGSDYDRKPLGEERLAARARVAEARARAARRAEAIAEAKRARSDSNLNRLRVSGLSSIGGGAGAIENLGLAVGTPPGADRPHMGATIGEAYLASIVPSAKGASPLRDRRTTVFSFSASGRVCLASLRVRSANTLPTERITR